MSDPSLASAESLEAALDGPRHDAELLRNLLHSIPFHSGHCHSLQLGIMSPF